MAKIYARSIEKLFRENLFLRTKHEKQLKSEIQLLRYYSEFFFQEFYFKT